MRTRSLYLLCFIARLAQADQVTLKNGDRITGAVVKKDDKVLTLKSEHLGEITVPWEQVNALKIDQPVTVVLADGQAVQGTLETRPGERISVLANGKSQEATLAEVSALRDADQQRTYERLLAPRWTDLWAGTASLGFAGALGNARTRTFTSALLAGRVTNKDKTTVYFNAVRASALIDGVSAKTAAAVRGGWGYGHNVSSRLFVNGFNDYEYDRFQNLDLRFVLGGGLGYIAWKGETGRLDLLGGLAYNRESFSPPAPAASFVRDSAESYFGDDFSQKLSAATSLYQSMRIFPNMSNGGEYRINFDIGANTRLLKWLVWNVAISNRFLSNPVPGRQTNDLLYTTGIGITFAR